MQNLETIIVAASPEPGVVVGGVGLWGGTGRSPYYPYYVRDNNPLGNFLGITHVHTGSTQAHVHGCAEMAGKPDFSSQNVSKMDPEVEKFVSEKIQEDRRKEAEKPPVPTTMEELKARIEEMLAASEPETKLLRWKIVLERINQEMADEFRSITSTFEESEQWHQWTYAQGCVDAAVDHIQNIINLGQQDER